MTRKVEFLPEYKWEELKSLIRVKSSVTQHSSGEITKEERFYISSLEAKAEVSQRAVKNHWAVENKLHWKEGSKIGLKRKQRKASYNNAFLVQCKVNFLYLPA